ALRARQVGPDLGGMAIDERQASVRTIQDRLLPLDLVAILPEGVLRQPQLLGIVFIELANLGVEVGDLGRLLLGLGLILVGLGQEVVALLYVRVVLVNEVVLGVVESLGGDIEL